MANTTSDPQRNETNNLRPDLPLFLCIEQRIAWQAQILQTTADHMAKMQEILSFQASLLEQHPCLEAVSQQIASLKGPVNRQAVEAWKGMKTDEGISDKPLGIQEPCHCCRHYGFPCLQNNSSKVKTKINQNHHPHADKKRKAISQETELENSQHRSLTAPSVLVQCSSQEGPDPKVSEVPQVRGNPNEILDVDKKMKAISHGPQLESSQHMSLTAPSVLGQCSSHKGLNPKESVVPHVRGNPHKIPDADKKRKTASQEAQLESSQQTSLAGSSVLVQCSSQESLNPKDSEVPQVRCNPHEIPDVDKKRKAISQEPQLESSQHLSLTAPSVPVHCSSQEGLNPKESKVPQVRVNPHEICLDDWSITYKEFQPRMGKQAKKQATEIKGAPSHQGSTPSKAARKVCFHCKKEGHFVAQCPNMHPLVFGNRDAQKHDTSPSEGKICNRTPVQSHQGSTPSKAAGKACFHCKEEGHFVAQCPNLYPLVFSSRDAQKHDTSPSEGKICNRTPVQSLQSSCVEGIDLRTPVQGLQSSCVEGINLSPKAHKALAKKLQPPQPSNILGQHARSQGPCQPVSLRNTPKKAVKRFCYLCGGKGHYADSCVLKNPRFLKEDQNTQSAI